MKFEFLVKNKAIYVEKVKGIFGKKQVRSSFPLKSSCQIRQNRNGGSTPIGQLKLNPSSCKKLRGKTTTVPGTSVQLDDWHYFPQLQQPLQPAVVCQNIF